MSDFNFDDLKMNDPFQIKDDLLQMDEEDNEIKDDFMEVEYGPEINIGSPLKEKTQDQLSEEIEDLFLSLLTQGDTESLLALTGESPYATDIISEDYYRGFTGNYSQALLYNPAIKWYAKLIKLLPDNKLYVEGGSLKLKISPQFFKKTIYPFLGDFKIGLRENSPIVNLIYNLAESIKDKDVDEKLNMVLDSQKMHPSEEEGLNPGSLNFEDNMLNTEGITADLEVDESDSMGGTSVDFTDNKPVDVQLQDLANKTIASYLMEQGITESDEIISKLKQDGFPRARIHEIIGIMKYMKLQDSLPKQVGNRGSGNVNFNFG